MKWEAWEGRGEGCCCRWTGREHLGSTGEMWLKKRYEDGVREETSVTSELCKGHSENYGFTGTEKESHLRR